MRFHIPSLVAPLAVLSLFGAGCFGSTAPVQSSDGGVWKSTDSGMTWVNKKALVSGAKVTAGVASTKIVQTVFDPQDNHTIYLATADTGLLYSLDAGESWQKPQGDILTTGRIGAIAVDPKNKCIVYAARTNSIFKTVDCGRDWERVFYDPRSDVVFTQLIVDWYNPTILFSGTSAGDVFRSQDSGLTWQISKRSDGSPIVSIAIDPRDSRLVYAATYGAGLLKTTDGGNSWTEIRKQFDDDLRDSRRAIQMVIDPVATGTVYVVSKYGIVRTTDGGTIWKGLKLTTPPGTVRINAMAIDPKNNKHIAYTGIRTLEFTTDGGETWRSQKLPTTQVGATIMFDPVESKVMYLGTTELPKQ